MGRGRGGKGKNRKEVGGKGFKLVRKGSRKESKALALERNGKERDKRISQTK